MNSADDPQLLVHAARASSAGVPIAGHRVAPAAAARRVASWLRRPLDEELGPEYETLLDLLADGAAKPLRAAGRSTEGARLADGARLGNAGPDPRGSARRSQGAPAGVSLVVVGLNHRTVPLDLLERMTVDEPGCPRRCTTSRRAST